MNEKTHHYTGCPKYETEQRQNQYSYLDDWDSDKNINHTRQVPYEQDENYEPLVLDIESNASYPQKPILVVAYYPRLKKLWIGYNWKDGTCGNYGKGKEEVLKIVAKEFEKEGYGVDRKLSEIHTTVTTNFMRTILNFVDNREENIEIVGHNVFYDLGILGKTNDHRLTQGQDSKNRYDGVIQYQDWEILHRRAGAKGRLYTVRKIQGKKPVYRNIKIADTQVVADSIRHNTKLEKLSNQLNINYVDNATEHGTLTDEYIKYNANDVRATLECYNKLKDYIRNTMKTEIPLNKLFSSASIGKDVMKNMEYDRVHYQKQAMSICSNSYYGGSTEALKKGEIIDNVSYMDVLSQYPTASKLTDVWKFMQAEKVECHEVDLSDTQFPTDLEEWTNKETWEKWANTYCLVDVDNSIIPVRVNDNQTDMTSVKKAKCTTKEKVMLHAYDVIASMMYNNKNRNNNNNGNIEIVKSWEMTIESKQKLSHESIGKTIIEKDENVMSKCIDERKRVQYEINNDSKDENTLALKIVANSLYGVSAERIVEEIKRGKKVQDRFDKAGTYYNPHVASTITSAGRFMLTLGELVAEENGGELLYCDTDSFIVPSEVESELLEYFNEKMENPYDGYAKDLDLLEIEDKEIKYENKENETVEMSNVSLFAGDTKKYCILRKVKEYNSSIKDKYEIVDFKEHGLGHYKQLRSKDKIKKFWSTLLQKPEFGYNISNNKLSKKELDELVTWQYTCSTYNMRQFLDQLTEGNVRYGDFVETTISLDNEGNMTSYVSLNFDDMDQYWKVVKNEELEVAEIEKVDHIDKSDQKTVEDIADQWVGNILHPDNTNGREHIEITETQKVTKEATSVKDAIQNILFGTIAYTDQEELSKLEVEKQNQVIQHNLKNMDISVLD